MMMTEKGLSSQDNQLSLPSSDKARERMGMTTFKFSTTADGLPKARQHKTGTRQDTNDDHNHDIDNARRRRQGKAITRQGTARHATPRGKATIRQGNQPQGKILTRQSHHKAKRNRREAPSLSQVHHEAISRPSQDKTRQDKTRPGRLMTNDLPLTPATARDSMACNGYF